MASKVPLPRKENRVWSGPVDPVFPPALTPPLPVGKFFWQKSLHNDYYKCEEAIRILVKKAEDLPQPSAPSAKTLAGGKDPS